jgi:hypothetical protein
MIVMMIASTASLNASSRLVVMRVSLESGERRSRRPPRHRELVSCSRAGSPGGWAAHPLAGPPGRRYRRGASGGIEGDAAWRYVAEELGPPGVHSRPIGMPTLRLRRLCTYSIGQLEKSRTLYPPGSRNAPNGYSWRFARQVGNVGAACFGGSRPPGSDCAKSRA